MPRVRLRGIYATALTERLRGAVEVVDPSDAIAERFDSAFAADPAEVYVADTADRLGVEITGGPDGVEAVEAALVGLGRDAFSWADPAPRGWTAEAIVTETLGSGAVVDLGPREGFLPYDATDRYVEAGDELSVQVHEPAPPWGDRRPAVSTGLEATAGPVTLVRGAEEPRAEVEDDGRANELVRSVDLLSIDVPEGWGVRFGRSAANASLEALEAALVSAAERAASVLAGEPPLGTVWVWFGRESRFALDAERRAVTATMPGHHRIKAGAESASPAVDFVEALWGQAGTGGLDELGFPFRAVTDGFGPRVGDELALSHGKPDGRRFRLGVGEVTGRDGETLTLRREMTAGGRYDGLGVEREAGDVAVTRLTEGKWWYPTVYRDGDGEVKGTYVNVCTPLELFPDAATYVDLEVDIVKQDDGTVERLDDDELDAALEAGYVGESLATKAREVAAAIEEGLSE